MLLSVFERTYLQSIIYVFQEYVRNLLHFLFQLTTVSNFEAGLMIHNNSFCFPEAKQF